jgi:hypothetical protein
MLCHAMLVPLTSMVVRSRPVISSAPRFVVALWLPANLSRSGRRWGRVSTRRDATTPRRVWARRRRERHIVCRVREAIGYVAAAPSRPSVTRAGIKHSINYSLVLLRPPPRPLSIITVIRPLIRTQHHAMGTKSGTKPRCDAAPIGPPIPSACISYTPESYQLINCISRNR